MTRDMWHLTPDTWHLTHHTWHVTCDTWHVTHGEGWTFSQNFSFIALTVWDLWCCEYLEQKDHSLTHSMNDEAVYRTAPATPGLLNIRLVYIYAIDLKITLCMVIFLNLPDLTVEQVHIKVFVTKFHQYITLEVNIPCSHGTFHLGHLWLNDWVS